MIKKKKNDKAYDEIKEIVKTIETICEDLVIADSSKHGWLTVYKLRGSDTTIPSDVQKKVEKIETRLDREKTTRKEYGEKKKPYSRYPRKVDQENGEIGQQQQAGTARRKAGPEELMSYLTKTRRRGTCSHCQQEGHFFKECPKFWTDVSNQRKEK